MSIPAIESLSRSYCSCLTIKVNILAPLIAEQLSSNAAAISDLLDQKCRDMRVDLLQELQVRATQSESLLAAQNQQLTTVQAALKGLMGFLFVSTHPSVSNMEAHDAANGSEYTYST
ncbi:hypothetical protein OC861_007033, partial [Tilletia horrida]